MSSVVEENLEDLSNDQLRLRLVKNGFANMPVTNTTRKVLIQRLRNSLNGKKSDGGRRDTIHVTKYSNEEQTIPNKIDSKSKSNRRATINVVAAENAAPKEKTINSTRRTSGRVTPSAQMENGKSKPIAAARSENIVDILEVSDEESNQRPVPKRTSRSPSLGKSQTVVTSFKMESKKTAPIDEEQDEENGDDYEASDDEVQITYDNRFNPNRNSYSTFGSESLKQSRTITNTYEPPSYTTQLAGDNYNFSQFKVPPTKPGLTTSYNNYSQSSGVNRRYTTNAYSSNYSAAARNQDDESGTEQSDIETPYLSDFARRLQSLKAEPLHKPIINEIKKKHHPGDDTSLWQSFADWVNELGRKYKTVILALIVFFLAVFIYVFFFMEN